MEESDELRNLIDASLQLPFELPGVTVSMSGSVGSASCESLTADLDVMLSAADEVLYSFKRIRHHGRTTSPVYPGVVQVAGRNRQRVSGGQLAEPP